MEFLWRLDYNRNSYNYRVLETTDVYWRLMPVTLQVVACVQPCQKVFLAPAPHQWQTKGFGRPKNFTPSSVLPHSTDAKWVFPSVVELGIAQRNQARAESPRGGPQHLQHESKQMSCKAFNAHCTLWEMRTRWQTRSLQGRSPGFMNRNSVWRMNGKIFSLLTCLYGLERNLNV